MNDNAREWIARREQLEEAATEGPWHWEPPSGDDWPQHDESLVTKDGDAVLLGWGYDASAPKLAFQHRKPRERPRALLGSTEVLLRIMGSPTIMRNP